MGAGIAATALAGPVAALESGTGTAVAAAKAAPMAAPADAPRHLPAEPTSEDEEYTPNPGPGPAVPPDDEDQEEEPSPEPSPEPEPEPEPEEETPPQPGPGPDDPPEDEDEQEPSPELPSETGGEGGYDCAPMDVPCMIFSWFNQVITDFLNNGLMVSGMSMMLTTPSSTGIQSVWETSAGIVNTSFVLIVTVAGVLVMGHQTVQTSSGIKEILPRLVLAFIAVNASWFICQQLGQLGNSISMAILGNSADGESVTLAMARFLDSPFQEGFITIAFMLMSTLAGVIFVFSVVIRLMLWVLLTAAAPLALAAHALPQTEGLARLWWRAIGALLIMQVGQALVMRIVMTLFLQREGLNSFDPDGSGGAGIELMVLFASLYVLIRVPAWAGKQIFNPSASPLVKVAKIATSLLLFKGMGLGKAAAGAKAGKAMSGAKSGAAGQRAAATRPPSGAAPSTPKTPRWHQSALPGMRPGSSAGSGRATDSQQPVPGIDSQIDPEKQQRVRERRRWVQPTLPSGEPARPPHHRQEALPGMESTPRGHQDPLPGMSRPSQARREALFEPTPRMRHAPEQRRSGFQQRQQQAERRRRAARQAAAQQHARGRRRTPPRHRGGNEGGGF